MKRIALLSALTLSACPVAAWEAGVDGVLCTLSHAEAGAIVRLTYDPSVPLYTIAVEGPHLWPVAGRFTMRFDGPQPNIIATDRHVVSPDRQVLSVSDRGFGNVMDGLQFNEFATAVAGEAEVIVSLVGAAPAVEAFRSCGLTPSV